MQNEAQHVAQQARFNNCPIISIHRDCNMKGQTQWEIYIGTDQFGGFREGVSPTKSEALDRARAIAVASYGFIKAIYAQRGGVCDMRKVSLT